MHTLYANVEASEQKGLTPSDTKHDSSAKERKTVMNKTSKPVDLQNFRELSQKADRQLQELEQLLANKKDGSHDTDGKSTAQ